MPSVFQLLERKFLAEISPSVSHLSKSLHVSRAGFTGSLLLALDFRVTYLIGRGDIHHLHLFTSRTSSLTDLFFFYLLSSNFQIRERGAFLLPLKSFPCYFLTSGIELFQSVSEMKGVKGKFLKKLKSIGQMGSLKHGRVLQVNASDGLLDPVPPDSSHTFLTPSSTHDISQPEPDAIDVAELMREFEEDEETVLDSSSIDKENIRPPVPTKTSTPVKENSEIENCNSRQRPLSLLDKSGYRRPDLNSGSLFDPDLLSAFQQAVMNHCLHTQDSKNRGRDEAESLEKAEPSTDPLLEFEERCPPGGTDSVILYTTSIRGIRKTFEDCNSIRFLLGSLKVLYSERDVSMHLEFREELWKILGGRVVPPTLFIKGRYIGGADEVVGLHEQGKLVKLLQGIPIDQSQGKCDECGGVRFVLCFECSGSCKITCDENECPVRCPSCNENGLIICPSCC